MAKFNLYKINTDQKDNLVKKIESVGLKKIGNKTIDGFMLDFYFSNEPEPIPIWWTEVYKDFFGELEKPQNKIYFATLLVYNSQIVYAVSLGKSHFYLKHFCDSDFGLNLAERIADDTNPKIKNSKFYKSRKNKIITTYQEGSGIDFDSGESIHYLRAKTIDKNTWGKTASFGHSAQFSIEIKPEELPNFIKKIEKTLKQNPRIKIPKVIFIEDEEIQSNLDSLLAKVLMGSSQSSTVQESDITLSGVDFIFSDQYEYSFYVRGDRDSHTDKGELTLDRLRQFISEKSVNIETQLNDVKVKVHNEFGRDFSVSLKETMDFVEEKERYCLIDGKWYQFNQSYLDFLKEEVDSIDFESQEDVSDKTEQEFNQRKGREGFVNCDRRNETLCNKYKVEKVDLYKDKILHFVKFGTPQKMNYVVDQAINTVKLLQNNQSKIQINDEEKDVETICLWLVFDRKHQFNKLSELNSLIFHMKLADWKRIVQNARYKPIIYVSYRKND
ncbi:DUF6119 family protein [Thermodesulfovibrio thiophilus]|uniref:DUF6119 family protein n=1 Tax=Thermodesulfovibrio thiophilus TaxID=340095 RepID=UPI00185B780A|nr:DUF6119 family protein [Thermodesulfovibrio thiophilus]HHW20406.1 TIGR04141 family sporadically distributed protein [Thermodesulfovibrio thiophilus]